MLVSSDINWVFYKYYRDNPELLRIIGVHSKCVAKKALQIAHKKQLELNPHDIYCAAMLHDIGVVKCNAPKIYAHGELPYIQHGIAGEKMLKENGLEAYADICVTHTGSGITREEILSENLPLPPRDMLPITPLEKLICYADKFFSKGTVITKEKSVQQIANQLEKFGEKTLERFMDLHRLFS